MRGRTPPLDREVPIANAAPTGAGDGSVVRLLAPLSGILVPLEQLPDPVFAQRIAGDGVSIDPMSNRVLAPCDGRVVQMHRAGHALTIAAAGLEIMIHVGIDTVQLKGDGFRPLVASGTDVRTGDALIEFDADVVAQRARSLLTQVLVMNQERIGSLTVGSGNMVAGRTVLMEVTVGTAAAASGAPDAAQDDMVTSAPVVVTSETGLHARPAALLASTARRFTSELRMMKNGQVANLRSVVSILALEVAAGQTVTVTGRGHDARAAVAAIVDTLTKDLAGAHPEILASRPAAIPLSEPATASPGGPSADGAYHGAAAAPGVALGRVYHLKHHDIVPEERAADANHERRALESAIAAAHLQLEAVQARLAAEADVTKAAIFAAHQELLEDPEVLDRAAAGIRGGATAAYAWQQAYTAQVDRLLALRNPLLAARAHDLRDVGRRVLHLLVGHEATPQDLPVDSIVVAEELVPTDVATLDRSRLRGFCTTMGSATSHVAILARGLGIPAITGIDPDVLDLPAGRRVVLDGDAGTLRVDPGADEEAAILRRQRADEERRKRERSVASEPATTRDNHRVEVVANIGGVDEGRDGLSAGAEGVGLLRTEFLFMDRRDAPDEDEQAVMYERIARTLGPDRILVIRTLDVGGDKPLPYLPVGVEANPFLGERGIRLSLSRPEVFVPQVRAILRASRAGKVAIMFPMISTLSEFRAARDVVVRECVALGVPPIQTGIMVETAAAALLADRFAEAADFFSIGTNDLTQYALAMDRSNPRLALQLDALHPAVLRLIERTVAGARAHGRWVGVCGALAGDPHAVPVLLGLGIDELSTDVPLVPSVKARVRELSLDECRVTAREALEASDAAEVRAIVARRHS